MAIDLISLETWFKGVFDFFNATTQTVLFKAYGILFLIYLGSFMVFYSLKYLKGSWMFVFDLEKGSINRKLKEENLLKKASPKEEKVEKPKRESFLKKIFEKKEKPDHKIPSPQADIVIDERVIDLIEDGVVEKILKKKF